MGSLQVNCLYSFMEDSGLINIKGSLDKPEAISDIKKLVNNLDKKDFLAHDTKGNLLLIEPNILSLLEFGGIDTTDQSTINIILS